LGTVQQCGGTIEVTSTIGVGTLFRVRLPTVTCQAQAAPVTPRMQRGTGLILVVDDEPALRAICRSILESCGYHVLEAENGAAAIDLVRNVGQDIDLVILDMIMPVMGGRDCFARLREIKPGLKTLLVSGYSHMDDLQELRQQGLAGLVAKPFRMAELSQAVAEALRGRPRHPSQPVGDGGVQP
jgi:CheY-like chemotaxis protein